MGEFKVGVVHGHQVVPWGDDNSLVKFAGKLGVDILVSGHTHRRGEGCMAIECHRNNDSKDILFDRLSLH